jgi:flagellin FlaB
MDLNQMVISYTDNNGGRNPNVNATPNLACSALTSGGLGTDVAASLSTQWCVAQKINEMGTTNNLLEPNEIWVIAIQTPSTATVNTKVTFNMQPAVGAVLPITRTLPGALNTVQAIY